MGKKKTVKKKPAKKVVKKKTSAANGTIETLVDLSTGHQRQQDLIPDAFPDRIDHLEGLAQQRHKLKEKGAKINESLSTLNDQIALTMIDEGLTHYKCYTLREELVRPEDIVRVRRVPEKEASPFDP